MERAAYSCTLSKKGKSLSPCNNLGRETVWSRNTWTCRFSKNDPDYSLLTGLRIDFQFALGLSPMNSLEQTQ